MVSTNPLTEEENNFLDHIEQKIHQQAARNAEEARQRQVGLKSNKFPEIQKILRRNISYDLFFRFSMKKI